MSEPITVGMASFPEREPLLYQAVRSLLPQVDRICVYLNGYSGVPDFLHNPKIRVATSTDYGDRGDAGKFFWSDRVREGYYLTCDDDLIYTPLYVERIIEGIERYGRRVPIGLHGAIFAIRPQGPYERILIPCLVRSFGDFFVNILGTGVMGYHVTTWQVPPSIFRIPNMADIWLARYAQEQEQPLVCIQHEHNWVLDLDPQNTIFDNSILKTGTSLDTFAEQCAAVATMEWRLLTLGKSSPTVDGSPAVMPCL